MATFLDDTFTDGTIHNLDLHTGETGATWTKHSISGGITLSTDAAGAVKKDAGVGLGVYYASGVPAGAEYDVTGSVSAMGSTNGDHVGVAGRIDTAASTMYLAYFTNAQSSFTPLRLDKVVAGSTTNLGASFGNTNTLPGDLLLSITDAAKVVKWIGVQKLTAADNAITAAGLAGVYMAQGTAMRLAGITASDIAAAATPSDPAFRRALAHSGLVMRATRRR